MGRVQEYQYKNHWIPEEQKGKYDEKTIVKEIIHTNFPVTAQR